MGALWRGARLRCPLCGTPWVRIGPVALAPRCHVCQLRIERGEHDYFLGSYTVNLGWALLAATILVVLAVALRLPEWATYGVGLPALSALVVALHPVSRLVWLALDLQFRRAEERDFSWPED